MWTGIPVFKLTEAETAKLMRMEEELHKRVIGQHPAIEVVSKAIRRSRAGLKDPKRPTGSFIFLGPSGVGKTELARTLAEFLFGDEDTMIRIDMSEYMEKHAVSRLVGSPPGYIGYDEGGQLTEAVRRKPYSVLLLDEIEKAHPDVFNILLQILEDGRLTDAQGRTVDFRHCIVIMTSNIGASEIARNTPLGFAVSDDETGITYDDMKNRIMGELKKVFRPEFLNRIDDVIVFHKLAKDEIKEIVELLLLRIRESMAERELQLELSEAAKDLLVEKGWDPVDGRPSAAPGDPALHRGPAGGLRAPLAGAVRVDRAGRAQRRRRDQRRLGGARGQALGDRARSAADAGRRRRRGWLWRGRRARRLPRSRPPRTLRPTPSSARRHTVLRRARALAWARRRLNARRLMPRATTIHVCSACGHETPRWAGRCPGCGEWNTMVEQPAAARGLGRPRVAARARPPRGRGRAGRARRRRRQRAAAAEHRDRRARQRARRRDRPRVAGPDRRLARDRQVDADDDGAGQRADRRPPHAVRVRRGVGGADPAAGRAVERRRGAADPGDRRDRPADA